MSVKSHYFHKFDFLMKSSVLSELHEFDLSNCEILNENFTIQKQWILYPKNLGNKGQPTPVLHNFTNIVTIIVPEHHKVWLCAEMPSPDEAEV